jgi:hypothetical protein
MTKWQHFIYNNQFLKIDKEIYEQYSKLFDKFK